MSSRRASRQKERKKTKSKKSSSRSQSLISKLKGNDSLDFKLNIAILLLLSSSIMIGVLTVDALANDPFGYSGGWETQSMMNKVVIVGENSAKTLITTNLHSTSYDTDGDFQTAVNEAGSISGIWPTAYEDTGVIVKTSYPYYLQQTSSGWVQSDDPYLVDTYVRDWTKDDGTQVHAEYLEYAVGVSVTIQTNADKYYKPMYIPFVQEGYLDYGWYFEDNVAEVEVRAQLALSPWTPSGVVDGWTLTGGWAGIMSMSVYDLEYGMIDPYAEENKGHVIQGLMSVNEAVNMYIPSTDTVEDESDLEDFKDSDDPAAIQGVPNSVEFEVYGTLGAGCKYETDILTHWTDVAVRNVYVTYFLRASFISTMVYELAAGNELPLDPPEENNTVYIAENTQLSAFLDYLENMFPGFMNVLILVVIGIIGVLFLVVIIKFARRKPQVQYVQAPYPQ